MSNEFIGAAIAIVTLMQLSKRAVLGGADALDELSHRRPLKRYRELIDAASANSRMRPTLELERDSELFRQVFGKPGSAKIENAVVALRASGEFSTRELRHLMRYLPYDAEGLVNEDARATAGWNMWIASLQAALIGVVILMSSWGALATTGAASLHFYVPVLAVSVPGFMYFVREAIHGHLARQAIEHVRAFMHSRAAEPFSSGDVSDAGGSQGARAQEACP